MDSLHIVPIYAALFALVFIVLSIRTIGTRRRERVSIGDGGKPDLQRAIRVHANFAEYVPLALILLAFVELQIRADWVVHVLGAILLAARISHAYGLSTEAAHFRFRVHGMQGTFFVIAASAVALLVNAIV
ncbi:MAG: MAPEG family protein [Alphaproteobacteria bacterium]|jgi:hypothetical protein|nr:MAPEG family protein [Alphaproteobacteria bacterium]|tara:strand:- start:727 stop:1119 length:393 start_codon:yes stop_codon:yes gene_type:complete